MSVDPIHVHETDVPWGDYSAHYPEEMMRSLRAKRLIGPGGAIPHDEMLMGIVEIDIGADYPAHKHDAPEAYYVLEGEAECAFDDETFNVRPGSAIHTHRNAVHSFRNTGTVKFRALGMWWAPGGDKTAMKCKLELLDE